MSLSQRIIERERLERILPGARVSIPGRPFVELQERITIGQPGVSEREFIVMPERLIEVADGFPESRDRAFAEVITADEVELVSLAVSRGAFVELLQLAARQFKRQRAQHAPGDGVSQRDEVGRLLVEFFRPEDAV